MHSRNIPCLIRICLLVALASCGGDGREKVNDDTAVHGRADERMTLPIELLGQKLTSRDGLPDNSIRNIYQDSKGFLWFATLNGLGRYDGTRFITYRKGQGSMSLQDNMVHSITEDRNGHLWISTNSNVYSCYDMRRDCFVDYTGTGDYLAKYDRMANGTDGDIWLWSWSGGALRVSFDGSKFSSRRFGMADFGTDSINFVRSSSYGDMWIGTRSGLFLYSGGSLRAVDRSVGYRRLGGFGRERFFITTDNRIKLTQGRKLRNIAKLNYQTGEKYTGNIVRGDSLLIFTTAGTICVNMKTGGTARCTGEWNIPNGETMTDNKGGVWIKNKTGCLRMVQKSGLKEFRLMPADAVRLIDSERYHVLRDSRGLVWITTYGNGLYVYDPRNDDMQHFNSGPGSGSPITSDFLLAIVEDRSGCIWVSSEYAGLSQLWVMNKGVKRIFPTTGGYGDRSNTVRMVCKLPSGDVMASTRTGGLYTYNADLTVLKSSRKLGYNVYAVCEDADGKQWLGTRDNGLFIGDRHYQAGGSTGDLSDNHIYSLLRDRRGHMWVGTFNGGVNLAVAGNDGYTFRSFLTNDPGRKIVRCLMEDRNGRIWVGTGGGLVIFDPDRIVRNPNAYYAFTTSNSSLPSDEIRSIMQDTRGRVWLAVPGAGLVRCTLSGRDYSRLSFRTFGTTDGLIDNMVQAVAEDRRGMLWVSTEYGMSVFNPNKSTFENYLFSEFMMGNVYSENSALRLNNGMMLFGTNYGMVVADPSQVSKNEVKPEVTFTDIKVNGLIVRPGDDDSPIEEALPYIDKISLSNSQNTFTVDFSTFNYSGGKAVKYSCMLEGFDREWSHPSTDSYVSYKNLPSGRYKLHVKACNAEGEWSDEAVLAVVVRPPFWLSWWAILIYIAVVGVAGFFIVRTMRNISRLHEKIRFEKNLTKYKLTFFTNISHEFRTPLTLIQGSLEKILKSGNLSDEQKYSAGIMAKSTRRMLRLINQLLEFRKMQNNKLSLALEQVDIVPLLRGIYGNFTDEAESKHIDYRFVPEVETLMMYVDKRHIDKIVYNLLSNAFKYTPSGGSITLGVKQDVSDRKLTITVADTGIGIPEEKRKELFSRFMQSNYSGDSFGIGLHLTHELVMVHKGTISYAPAEGGGSVFTVTLPTDKSVYEDKDFLVAGNVLLKEETERDSLVSYSVAAEKNVAVRSDNGEPLNRRRVLVVEDDNDVREFVSHELRPYFEVEAVAEAKSALEYASANDVDLIVSDVMMPGMDGYELTRRIKSDFATSHIPVILLTALSNSESEYKGIDSGADAYITKPFSPQLLLRRIFTLIEQRDRLREKFTNDITAARPALCSTDQDKAFADRLTELVEREMADVNFGVERCVEVLGMGRTGFFRKVKGVTGYTPNEFIRIMRMKRAAEMLLKENLTVSEVSYKVGIDDPLYFSKCFKKQFGVPPTSYRKGQTGGD